MPNRSVNTILFAGHSWPYGGSVCDLDFIRQRYWWGGSQHSTSHFTTYTLNGSTFDANGLTPSATIDVTIALSGVGAVVPGAYGLVFYSTSTPGAGRTVFHIDDGTNNERVNITQSTTPACTCQVIDGGAPQSNVGGSFAIVNNQFTGFAASVDTNNFLASTNGVAGAADVAGTLPTVTILRIGKGVSAGTEALGAIARIVLFPAVKTQSELNQLTSTLRA